MVVCGDLVLKMVSRLDAFSGYPYPNVANPRLPVTITPHLRPTHEAGPRIYLGTGLRA